jgi:hypothetical protein
MKYKVGDKVRIKTWAAMMKEFIPSTEGSIQIHPNLKYASKMEVIINHLDTDRIVTIKKVINDVEPGENRHYKIEESTEWAWTDHMIEHEESSWEPIETRFEIMDL